MNLDAARATAGTRLDETCVIRRPGADTYTPETGITSVPGAVVWSGPCSLGAPEDTPASTVGGDERRVPTRVLRLPADATASLGDVATVAGRAGTYTVTRLDDRPQPVLRHLRVTSSVDAPGVPV